MAAKSDGKGDKVMDVSRPGKGKIIINSRPLAAPLVSDKAESGDVLSQPEAGTETAPILAPSAAKKVIQPINVQSDSDEESKVEVKPTTTEEASPEPEAEPAPSDTAPIVSEEPDVSEEGESSEEAEPVSDEPAIDDKPASSDSLPTPQADDSPIAPAAPATDQSGAASVDELAKAAEQKRLASEKTKEEAERDQKVQELIKSKQYFVPIKHSGPSGKKMPLILLLVTLLLVIAGYLAMDIGIFGKGMKLPYEFFKEDDREAQDSSTSVVTNPTTQSTSNEPEEKQEEPATQTDPGATTPEDRAADDEIKNELKNLQQKLETYFNDNNAYPAALAELVPAPTADETQDDSGQAYTYTSDNETYVLSAKLSDGTTYTLNSVNQ